MNKDVDKLFNEFCELVKINFDEIPLFWNIDTSFTSCLSFMKSLGVGSLVILSNKDNEVDNKGVVYPIIGDTNKPKAKSTIIQYIRIGILFDIFEYQIEDNYKSHNDFFYKVKNNKLELKFKKIFLEAHSIVDYVYDNIKNIIDNWKHITLLKESNAIINDTKDLIFDLILYSWIRKNNKEEREVFNYLKNRTRKKLTVSSQIMTSYNQCLYLVDCIDQFLYDKPEINEFNKYNQAKEKIIGYAGEFIFDLFARNISKYKNKIPYEKLKKVPFKNIVWESVNKPKSPYDFKIDNTFIEVKSTTTNLQKTKFILSSNEWYHITEHPDSSYVCHIKNIKPENIDFSNQLNNIKLLDELTFKFLDYSSLNEDYFFNERGFYVNQK